MNAVAPPNSAVSHIQNIEPAPPSMIAVATPMMLPVPTRDAVETISAPNEEMPFSDLGFSETTLIDSLNMLSCMNLVCIVKYRPPASSRSGTSHGLYSTSLTASTTSLIAFSINNSP